MIDFSEAREKMVDCQVRTVDVTNHDIISAMLDVPREAFVSETASELAYIDQDIALDNLDAQNRFLMMPASFASLLQACDVQSSDVVMVVGSGSGYSAAVFSRLASSIVAIETVPALVEFSSAKLAENGFDNVVILESALDDGFEKEAPYDVIFIEGAVEDVPEKIIDQMAEGGRLVTVLGAGNSGRACLFVKSGGIVSRNEFMNCSVKPLPGFEKKAGFVF